MDAYEYSELLKLLNTKLNNIKGILKPDLLNQRLQEIIELESAQDFWNDIENATKIGIEKNRILGKLNKFNKAYESLNGTNELYEMANSEKDEDTLELLYDEANDLEDLIHSNSSLRDWGNEMYNDEERLELERDEFETKYEDEKDKTSELKSKIDDLENEILELKSLSQHNL